MQVIGSRGCSCRVELPFAIPRLGYTNNPMTCSCGGPWIVVEDWTDSVPLVRQPGQFWTVDIKPDSPTWGHAVLVDWDTGNGEYQHRYREFVNYLKRTGRYLPWNEPTVGTEE